MPIYERGRLIVDLISQGTTLRCALEREAVPQLVPAHAAHSPDRAGVVAGMSRTTAVIKSLF